MAQKYLTSGTIRHGLADGSVLTFKNGDEFSVDDEGVVAGLRLAGSLLTPEEFAAAEASEGRPQMQQELSAQRMSLEDENARLRAELAALRGESAPEAVAAEVVAEEEAPKE